jgi:two-component system, NarL family, sensor histidine kinase DesK
MHATRDLPRGAIQSRNFQLHDQPWFGLAYLLFAYAPLLFDPRGARPLLATLAATAVFLPVYFGFYRRAPHRAAWPWILAVAAVGYGLIPFNVGGNTFIIYAVGMAAASLPQRRALALNAALLLAMALEFLLVIPLPRVAGALSGIMCLVAGIVMAGIFYSRSRERHDAELRLTQDEVRRLAGMAERERIGRDLHDLLGHTLAVVTLKSELAGKLVERDPAAAQQQMREVESIAREAMAQVREAVSGIRAAGLEAELVSARLALLAADVRLDARLAPLAIEPATEQALALVLREATTNIVRHAGAGRVEVELTQAAGRLRLSIADDGRGGARQAGHGLTGMRERARALGGTLEIDSPAGGGTRVTLDVPQARIEPRA